MKYNILGFNQKKLIDNKLDVNDALILRTIKDMYSSSRMEFVSIDDKRYMWLNLKYFTEQILIVGNKRKIQSRLTVLHDKGFIEKKLLHEYKGTKGTYLFIRILPVLDNLEDYDMIAKKEIIKKPVRLKTSVKANKFSNFEQKTNKYSALELEKIVNKRRK